MVSWLRRFKASYALYNFFNYKRLKHNIPLYKRYGIKKLYFSPISSVDMPDKKMFVNKLDTFKESETFNQLSNQNKQSLLQFNENGFAILSGYLSSEQVDAINQEVQDLIDSKRMKMRYNGRKLMFAFKQSQAIRAVSENLHFQAIMDACMGDESVLFQSINFVHAGSEQKTHSDSIHMTTYPLGGLLGVWFALEDIDERNGALHYYPGSHTRPYLLNPDFNNIGGPFLVGPQKYEAYEDLITKQLKSNPIPKVVFKAKKGDVLIWHANLLHGGEPHLDRSMTRKSMVFHYYAKNAICYHEISQRPALMD